MSQLTVDQALQLALQHQQAGQLAEAEDLFRQILEAYPDQADALHLLGALYVQAKRPDVAESTLRHALLLRDDPAFKITLGLALQATARYDEAVALYRSLAAARPDFIEAYLHMGVALSAAGKFEESARAFQEAVTRSPDNPVAQGNLGVVLVHLRRFDEAIWMLREALVRQPRDADFHAALGAALFFKGQFAPAEASCRQAIALNPRQGQAHNVLADLLRDTGRPAEAAAAARQAAELLPDFSEAQINYGESLRAAGTMDAATAHYRRALERLPASADLHNNLGNCLKDSGLLSEAIAEYRAAVAGHPHPAHMSNLLYTIHYHPDYSPQRLDEELRQFDRRCCQPVRARMPDSFRRPFDNPRDASPARKLRIGYISTEFRQHALGLNLLPLFNAHDKSQFEIYCYADVKRPDFFTFRIRQCADHWQDIAGMSDEAVAALVRRDQIDILVDLHQHIGGNKLPVYFYKPAPVQIAFAGYPGSTGLSTIDYRLTDPWLEPPGQPAYPSVEKVLRLPATWWCYHPIVETPINELPALTRGTVTFGNLNNFCKLNDRVYALWADILNQVEGSDLLLLAPEGAHRDHTKDFFESRGIARSRIHFAGRKAAVDYYKLYHQFDISLDSFPCNGHTTSMDSFFMGVPVTTTIGNCLWGRATWSQLNNLGLPELAGKDDAGFVAKTVELAKDLPRLAELRRTLRPRMKNSLLMNDAAFARGIEQAYRQAWQTWCETPPAP
jgi:predicted O-linked N-acetylglucosamine transferase (SPINDLY family)